MFGPFATANFPMLLVVIVLAVFQPKARDPDTYWAFALTAVLMLVAGGLMVKGMLRLRLVHTSHKGDRLRIAAGVPLEPEHDMTEAQGDGMEYVFRGGFEIPGRFSVQGPWVILTMSPSQLEFRPRSRWWARHFGPWRLERSAVREVYPGRPHPFYSWGRVNFLAKENMPWTFLAEWPEGVLGAAEELGYPVRYDDDQIR